jgi:tetratricopeptide (TPR) repeat protein
MKPLEDYRRFLEEYGCTHLLQDPDRLIYGHIRDIEGVKVGIAGLNTAWSCGKDGQKGKLWLAGQWQIRTLSQKITDAKVKIALMHHPFNWFNPVEDPQLDRSMRKYFDFLLHGHEHDDWVKELKRGFITISAGACYAGSSKELGYNMVRWDVNRGGGKAWLRTYETKGGGWVPELIAGETDDTGGAWALGNDERGVTTPGGKPPTPEQKRQDIPPGSPESRGIFGRQGDIERIKKSLDSSPMAGIYGMAGIGKSQIVKEIKRLPRFKDMDYVPCFVDKEMDLQKLFRQLARALGCTDEEPKASFEGSNPGTFNFSILRTWTEFSKPAFIHLIDVHLFFEDYILKDSGIKEFLEAICKYYPRNRIALESRISLKNEFPPTVCPMFYIGGIDSGSMALYYKYPFKEDPSVGWKLTMEQESFLFRRLGGSKDLGGAMPLAMMLLANVAKGTRIHPVQVLKEYEGEKEFAEKLENRLFNDLYENVLTDAEQHMLRLSALYREGIPNSHENALNGAVEAPGVFWHLVQRCLLDTNATEDWYFLHAIIAQLTRWRIDRLGNREQYWNDHDTIADAWLAQLKLGSQPSLPNIKAANEAFYHLTESENYDRYYELSDKLLRKDVVPYLEQCSRKLQEDEKYGKNRHLLELLVRLEPKEPKFHRFLGHTIEKVKGKGDDEALKHYREARRLLPDYPDYLNVLGRCLMARGESEVFIEEVEKLREEVYHKVMD